MSHLIHQLNGLCRNGWTVEPFNAYSALKIAAHAVILLLFTTPWLTGMVRQLAERLIKFEL